MLRLIYIYTKNKLCTKFGFIYKIIQGCTVTKTYNFTTLISSCTNKSQDFATHKIHSKGGRLIALHSITQNTTSTTSQDKWNAWDKDYMYHRCHKGTSHPSMIILTQDAFTWKQITGSMEKDQDSFRYSGVTAEWSKTSFTRIRNTHKGKHPTQRCHLNV